MDDPQTDPEDSGTALGTIARGASLHVVGTGVSKTIGLVFNVLLTRTLGATLFGVYAYAATIVEFVSAVGRLGTAKALFRFVPPAADRPQRNAVAGIAYASSFLASVAVAAVLFVAAPVVSAATIDAPPFVGALRILALALPVGTLTAVTTAVFRSVESPEYQELVSNVVEPVVRTGAVLLAVALGYSLLGTVAAIALGSLVTLSIALAVLYSGTDIRPTLGGSRGRVGEFLDFSLPLTLKDVGQRLYTRVDILVVGALLTGSAVGVYRVSVLVATMLVLPLSAVNRLFPPVASRLHEDRRTEELESVYATLTRWVFTAALLPGIAVALYAPDVLRIFGTGFGDGAAVLSLLAVAQVINCAVGPSGYLLMMTDHQYLNLANQWTLGVLNAVLSYLLVLEFGVVGAAVGTAGVLSAVNALRVVEVWYLEGMSPYSIAYWKPLLAGVAASLVMLAARGVASGFALLVLGPAAGTLIFVGVIVSAGFESEDLEFFREYVAPRFE
jgi:O-antigen/teichoic acid export membrane protein